MPTCFAVIAAVLVAGFSFDMTFHETWNPWHYPWYVHAHALSFSGWIILFLAQIWLARSGNITAHKRVGRLALVLLPLMLFFGPATAIWVKTARAHISNDSLSFAGTQFTNVLGCVVLLTAGLLMRNDPSSHKRLMLMGTIAITEPGFSRLIYDPMAAMLGERPIAYYFDTYIGTLSLMLAVGVYDLATRRRLHPAYLAAFLWVLANQILAVWLNFQPFWLAWMKALTGH